MRWLKFFGLLVLGVLLGAYLAQVFIRHTMRQEAETYRNGQWQYFPSMDLADNLVQRAAIARAGLFAIRESEVLYVLLDRDESGNPLSSDKNYELNGTNMAARYWSITLYGEDHFLIPNSENRYSFNQATIQYEDSSQNDFRLIISSNPQAVNWLPSGEGQHMSLLLRMYHPDPSVYQEIATTPLPILSSLN